MALLHTSRFRVVLDTDTVTAAAADLERYLIGLLGLADFLLMRYGDQGPPATDRRRDDFRGTEYAPGWLMVHPIENSGYGTTATATYSEGNGGVTRARVGGGDLLELPYQMALRQLENPTDAQRDQLRKDLTLPLACGAADAAILVTNRTLLL